MDRKVANEEQWKVNDALSVDGPVEKTHGRRVKWTVRRPKSATQYPIPRLDRPG